MRIIAAFASGILACGVAGGPIDPPAGPVGPTMKPLHELEPRTALSAAATPGDNDATPSVYRITQPGSYYLTGNVGVAAGKIGIEIASDDVTLDLGGFSVSGGLACIIALHPNGPGTPLTGIRVTNGSVRGATAYGCGLPFADGSHVENLTALECDVGVQVGEGCTVRGCTARGGRTGFQADQASIFRDCSASENEETGFLLLGDGGVLSGCMAAHNGGLGYLLGQASSITNSVAMSNDMGGFAVLQDCIVADCTAKDNGGIGVQTGQGCVVRNTASSYSGTHGIEVSSLTTVEGCTTRYNGHDGINAGWQCRIVSNTCTFNGQASAAGAGIRLVSYRNRVESNMLNHNDKGVVAEGTDNFIATNTAGSNSGGNFEVAAGNEMAPVVTNPGSSGFAGMTPWSNVAY
ncbi:MAG TPA: right-handed parallel beta-helix repeat-containing protein [Phycisphaerales bacterium]|nr:right-handed parallel beta-helix repeat-containing protein [Phycisphaerales bacterium]